MGLKTKTGDLSLFSVSGEQARDLDLLKCFIICDMVCSLVLMPAYCPLKH